MKKKLGIGKEILLLLVAVLVFAANYVSPAVVNITGFIALLTPFVLIFFAVVFIYRIGRRSLKALLPGVVLIFGFRFITAGFGFHVSKNNEDSSIQFNVLSYNVRVFNIYAHLGGEEGDVSKKMVNWTADGDYDIVCLQEAYVSSTSSVYNLTERMKNAGLEYVVFPAPYVNRIGAKFGTVIYSKFPVVNKGVVLPEGKGENKIIFADLIVNKDTVRVYNVHLESMHIDENTLDPADQSKENLRNLYQKLKIGFAARAEQADRLIEHAEACNYKVIICGDLNDVPYSYTYRSVRRKYKNAFESAGWGFGFTYNGNLPFLRIDNHFFSEGINVHSFDTHKEADWSDHFPVSAVYSLK